MTMGRLREIWLLPIAFAIHDGEEVLTMPAWIAAHGPDLERVARLGTLPRRAIEHLPDTTEKVLVAASFELLVLIAATALATRYPRRAWAMSLYAALLGIFVAHSVTHALLSVVVFPGYTPGVVSALIVIPLAGLIIYRRLISTGLLTVRRAVTATIVGAILFVPLFVGLLTA
jgi:Protein of unknown function with HXXEE motif